MTILDALEKAHEVVRVLVPFGRQLSSQRSISHQILDVFLYVLTLMSVCSQSGLLKKYTCETIGSAAPAVVGCRRFMRCASEGHRFVQMAPLQSSGCSIGASIVSQYPNQLTTSHHQNTFPAMLAEPATRSRRCIHQSFSSPSFSHLLQPIHSHSPPPRTSPVPRLRHHPLFPSPSLIPQPQRSKTPPAIAPTSSASNATTSNPTPSISLHASPCSPCSSAWVMFMKVDQCATVCVSE